MLKIYEDMITPFEANQTGLNQFISNYNFLMQAYVNVGIGEVREGLRELSPP